MYKLKVIARHYTEQEEFDLGYQCKKCGLRFANIQDVQKHSKTHQRIKMKKCEFCGVWAQLQRHHITYEPEETVNICPKCHGEWHAKHTPNWGKLTKPLKETETKINPISSAGVTI